MSEVQLTYAADGLFTTHNCDFMYDSKFLNAYGYGCLNSPREIDVRWRAHVAIWAASIAARLDGNFIECGVHTGILSGTVMTWLEWEKQSTKHFFLLDTWEGIPLEQLTFAETERGLGKMNRKYLNGEQHFKNAMQKFSKWKNCTLIRGKVPESFKYLDETLYSYVSIDMNVAAAEIAAAEYFWPKMVAGGLMLLDDYGWSAHIHQKIAFDRFAEERNVHILTLPTGQGLIVKPTNSEIV